MSNLAASEGLEPTPRANTQADTSRLAELLEASDDIEQIVPSDCVEIASIYQRLGDSDSAYAWLKRAVTAGDAFSDWQAAATVMKRLHRDGRPGSRRVVKVAIASSYTADQLGEAIQLACLRWGLDVELYQAPFGQYQQVALDPDDNLHSFEPDFAIIAVHAGDLRLPEFSTRPADLVRSELDRWRDIWKGLSNNSGATIIQHNFVQRPEDPFGHLATQLPGSRGSMVRRLNDELALAASEAGVRVIDCDRLASTIGKRVWFDDRYWYLAKQAVALSAVPFLARHTAAVVAASLGLTKKCLVLDLDGTLWGGVLGEDGLEGIELGSGATGEAFVAFQEYVLKLKERGIVLAVCSKNDERSAKEPFMSHPDMRIRLSDVAQFTANWNSKVDNLQAIARALNLAPDALVLADDSPAERHQVRLMLPEVEVLPLPSDPSQYIRVLDDSLLFEPGSFTEEDAARNDHYRARAQADGLKSSAATLEEFHRDLDMQAIIAPFDEFHLPRIAQLVAKTNQFNLTTRRHSTQALRGFMERDPTDCVHFYARLRDRFADHGLVAVIIAERADDAMVIDTWLMSCRVIGRTLDRHMMNHLSTQAIQLGCKRLVGEYIPTDRNALVTDLYKNLGFELVRENESGTTWEYDLSHGAIESDFITTIEVDS